MNLVAHWEYHGLLYCEPRLAKHVEGRHGDCVHTCPTCFGRTARPHPMSTMVTEPK